MRQAKVRNTDRWQGPIFAELLVKSYFLLTVSIFYG